MRTWEPFMTIIIVRPVFIRSSFGTVLAHRTVLRETGVVVCFAT